MDKIATQLDEIIASQKALIELMKTIEEDALRQHEELMKLLKGEEA